MAEAKDPLFQALIGIVLIPERDLARALGFKQVSWRFKEFIDRADIEPVPGRPGFYDPKLVRARLDAMQKQPGETDAPVSLTQQRRKRRAKA